MSDRLELLRPLITPGVQKIITRRLIVHEPLIKDGNPVTDKQRGEIKVALLAVHIINPLEEFFAPEEALIRGISTDTLATYKAQAKDGQRELKKL